MKRASHVFADVLSHFFQQEVTLRQLEDWLPRVKHQGRSVLPESVFVDFLRMKGINTWPPGKNRLHECESYIDSSRKRFCSGTAAHLRSHILACAMLNALYLKHQ